MAYTIIVATGLCAPAQALAGYGIHVQTMLGHTQTAHTPVPKRWTPTTLRAFVYRTDSCLANIIERESAHTWDPTIDYGGGHGNIYESYGLGQANPGTKMAPYGKDWRTSPWTQLRWAKAYAKARYGSTCGAWAFWQIHRRW